MTFFRQLALKFTLACAVLLSAAAPSTSHAAGPADTVEAFHNDLLSVMKKSEDLGISGRYENFLNHLDRYFHMPLMVSFVSGKHWAKANKDQRIKLNQAARRMSAGELAVLFSGYSGETFKTLDTQVIKDKSVLVKTELERVSDSSVNVTYRLRNFGENWRIIDVLLDGSISQLLKRRDEYHRTLEDKGIEGLIALLNAKADEILNTNEAANRAK